MNKIYLALIFIFLSPLALHSQDSAPNVTPYISQMLEPNLNHINSKDAYEVAKELENILIRQFLNEMDSFQLKPNKTIGRGRSERIYRELLNYERAKSIDIGIAKSIAAQIISIQGSKKNDRKK